MYIKSFIAIGLLITLSQAALQRFEFNIDYRAVNPDCHKESFNVPAINGQFPGPTIYATEGDEIEVLVRNQLENANTSIHYHGIRQIGSTESDGVPGVTQEPIRPGRSFRHRFLITQAGTYFYHAHVGLQDDSVQGAFIVYESPKADPRRHHRLEKRCTNQKRACQSRTRALLEAGPYTYKKDLILQLSEWWHDELSSRQDYYMGSAFKYDHGADSILFNGRSIYDPLVTDGTRCLGYTTLDVEPNSVYRLRVIGGNTFRTLALGIKDHNMTLIEVDGELIHPYQTSFLEVTPGQRFSVLLYTGNYQPGTTFAIGTSYLWRQRGRGITENGFAYIRYVERHPDANHSHLFKSLSKWYVPKKTKGRWGDGDQTRGRTVGDGSDHARGSRADNAVEHNGRKWNGEGTDHRERKTWDDKTRSDADVKKKSGLKKRQGVWNDKENHTWPRNKDNHHSYQRTNQTVGHSYHFGGHQQHEDNAYEDLPTFPRMDQPDWIWHHLAPLAHRDPILDATKVRTIRLHTSLRQMSDNTTRYFVNNRTNPNRPVPALYHFSHFHKRAMDEYDDDFYTDLHTYRIGYNEIIDLVFQNTKSKGGGCMLHPWHTHGHSHYVIASGSGDYIHDLHKNIRNFNTPLYKDTSVAYPSYSNDQSNGCGWTKVRFKAVSCHFFFLKKTKKKRKNFQHVSAFLG